jgi:glycosyltransferase involved in cell wall biosynthesis
MSENTKVTFIIPSIGRDTLKTTICSLINQTNPNWKAIIIFDGISPTEIIDDNRITVVQCSKLGEGQNSAGLVRNYGILLAETEWIAFVDDDDVIKSTYIDIFLNEIIRYENDVIIFRMISGGQIIPNNCTDNFYMAQVGISFAVKRCIFESGIIFEPSNVEDYILLDNIRQKKYKMMISPYLLYSVRNFEIENNDTICNRVLINH